MPRAKPHYTRQQNVLLIAEPSGKRWLIATAWTRTTPLTEAQRERLREVHRQVAEAPSLPGRVCWVGADGIVPLDPQPEVSWLKRLASDHAWWPSEWGMEINVRPGV